MLLILMTLHINDNYGHLVGDKVLTYVVRRIREVFAEGEIIGRIEAMNL